MFTGGRIWILTHGHATVTVARIQRTVVHFLAEKTPCQKVEGNSSDLRLHPVLF